MNIYDELEWRGLIADCTDKPELLKRLAAGPITLYCGFDPTADSLHVGNLVPLLALRRFQLCGHHPIALAGGATGMVGDPSGKSSERNLLSPDQLAHNIAAIKGQLTRFLDFGAPQNPARLVNNADWIGPITFLDFLRDVGKHITVNQMVAKDSVRSRMEDRDSGISFTEFSYMLLQGYDFYHLRNAFDCELQVGATDQWGNITVGTELTRKKLGTTVWGLTFPLLTKADGTKYGKSASGAVYLDPNRTSPYRFYQFFIQSDDADVVKLLKTLTFVSRDEIAALEAEVQSNPGARAAQKRLAKELTTLVHGEQAALEAIRASEAFFNGSAASLPKETLDSVKNEIPSAIFDPSGSTGYVPLARPLYEVIAHFGISGSKGQAKKDIESGGIYVKDLRVTDPNQPVTANDFLFGEHMIVRKGKKNYFMISGSAPIAGSSSDGNQSSVG